MEQREIRLSILLTAPAGSLLPLAEAEAHKFGDLKPTVDEALSVLHKDAISTVVAVMSVIARSLHETGWVTLAALVEIMEEKPEIEFMSNVFSGFELNDEDIALIRRLHEATKGVDHIDVSVLTSATDVKGPVRVSLGRYLENLQRNA